MIVDVTTHNKIYNTVGSQAQWYRHRWGRRDYPELDLSLSDIPDNHIYHLTCIYGDPADWKHINQFLENTDKTIFIDTYGMFDDLTIDLLSQKSIGFIKIKVDGWTETMGKVYLHQQLDAVKKTARSLRSVVKMEYAIYDHNVCDIKGFKFFCESNNIEYEVVLGEETDNGLSCIVNENGEWLYDIFSVHTVDETQLDRAPKDLDQTTTGYERLKTYLKGPDGRSILEHPLIPQIANLAVSQDIKDKFQEDTVKFIAPTGQLFENIHLGQIFMLLLASDWKFTSLDLPNLDDYEKSILYAASLLSTMVQ